MKKQITKISAHQTSKVLALLYIFLGIPHAFIGLIVIIFADGPQKVAGIMFLFMPIIMCVMGYVMFAIMAFIYNFPAIVN